MTIFSRHPVDNPVISYGFGAGGDKWGQMKHLGADYAADEGTAVYAPAGGTVVRATDQASPVGNPWEQIPGSSNNGNHVILRHDAPHQATHTLYAHLSAWTVREGQHVNAGDLIGYVGNTGYSFGAHLHWEAFIDYAEGVYPVGTFYGRVDPLDYFSAATVVPVSPGNGGTGSTSPAAPTKEWDEMASKEEIDAIVKKHIDGIAGTWFENAYGRPVQLKSILSAIDKNQNGNNAAVIGKLNAILAEVTVLRASLAEVTKNPDITPEALQAMFVQALGPLKIAITNEAKEPETP